MHTTRDTLFEKEGCQKQTARCESSKNEASKWGNNGEDLCVVKKRGAGGGFTAD